MKSNRTFFNALGVALALAVPAVVVAQQFAANQPLRSADLQALVNRVAALEAGGAAQGSGPSAQLLGQLVTADQVPITANSDGFLLCTPAGTGFGNISVQIGVNATGRHVRATEGDSALVPLSAGDVANVTPIDLVAPADVNIRWFPLQRNGALPSCPACVQ